MASNNRYALDYAERGWPILPLAPREKRPLTKTGLLEASDDPNVINEWFRRWPMANIGLRTGVAFDALDIDGEVGLASLAAKAGPRLAHLGPVSRTGRGQHWLYAPTGMANSAGLLNKVDWRGVNGYIVAPPSTHPDGHTYEWDKGPDGPLPTAPDWMLALLTPWREREAYVPRPIRIMRTNPYSKNQPSRNIVVDPERLAMLAGDIVQMAEDLGYAPRPDGGGRYAINCPFHEGDRDPSMKLYTNDNSFYCFGCGAWGDSVNLRDNRPGGPRA